MVTPGSGKKVLVSGHWRSKRALEQRFYGSLLRGQVLLTAVIRCDVGFLVILIWAKVKVFDRPYGCRYNPGTAEEASGETEPLPRRGLNGGN